MGGFVNSILGGVGDVISGIGGAVEDVVSGIGEAGQGIIDAVSNIGADLDDFVNETIPGGWVTVGLAVALLQLTRALNRGQIRTGSQLLN